LSWLKNICWSDEESDDDTGDADFYLSPVATTPSSSIYSGVNGRSKRAALNHFLQLMHPDHSSRSLLITHSYNQLKKGSKKNFLSSTQFAIDTLIEFLAGSDADQIRQELFLKYSSKLISRVDCR